MNIDFTKYQPPTVLRVECRDGVLGYVHVTRDTSPRPYLLVRDDGWNTWCNKSGSLGKSAPNDGDVVRIIGPMKLEEAC